MAIIAAVALPAVAQERGGKFFQFTARQSADLVRNPDFNPGDTTLSYGTTTDLSFGVISRTRSSELSLLLDTELSASNTDGFEIGDSGATLSYGHKAPGAQLDAVASVRRQSVSSLGTNGLITLDDGTVILAEDYFDLYGAGTRTTGTYRLSAQFGEDRPFGWGIIASGSNYYYHNTVSPNLVDGYSAGLSVNARFDVTPAFSVTSRVGYSISGTDTTPRSGTAKLDLGASHSFASGAVLRARTSYALPQTGSDRFTFSVGGLYPVNRQTSIDVDLGTTLINFGSPQIIGRVGLNTQLTKTVSFSGSLSRQVTTTTSGDIVLPTAAQLGLDLTLTPQDSLSFGASYAAQRNLTTTTFASDLTLSAGYNRMLNEDWGLSVGASHTIRQETGSARADQSRVFVTVGRSWTGRF